MKVTIISPPFPFTGRVPMVPPILEYLGALTIEAMPDVELDLLDANIHEPRAEEIDADIVCISAMTATVNWVYQFADSLRELGRKVVLGGIHPTALHLEAKEHADSVVVGEAESVWLQVLSDAAQGTLKPFYHGERLPLDNQPMPYTSFDRSPYRFRAVFTARGCPYRCSFCSVRKFFGDTMRYRPIHEVVEEVENHTGKVYFNGDDNIWGGDIERSIELFTALSKGSKKRWYGFGDLRAPQSPKGDEMLKAARASGLFSVWMGWETSSGDVLDNYHAGTKQGRNREDAIKKIKSYGIDVVLFVVLGGRHDTPEDFDNALELAKRLGVGVHPVLLTPLPGTELYDEYKPYLIKERGWEYYTGVNAVFEHPDPGMTPFAREKKYYKTSLELLSLPRILSHLTEIPWSGFPMTHLLSLMKQFPMRRAMKKAYKEWKVRENNS
ncbi:MAG: B12-binding domain-containing radical SAM protein [ANME-2 cluster archaeon]|nr:B12-binding domain-containing radical SAM protein [ANME-2 cluster archaeon]